MAKALLSFVFNAHLPFVRHPEHSHFLEENWLFEALSETYLPLLRSLEKLHAAGYKFRFTFSISPTLASMLSDEVLQKRYIVHADNMIKFAEAEIEKAGKDDKKVKLAKYYLEEFRKNKEDYTVKYRNNVLHGFKNLQKEGCLDIITSSATHSYLPLYQDYPKSIEAQIDTAILTHGRFFSQETDGIWIPELGYFPGLDRYLKASNIKYFFVEAHGLLLADNKPKFGVYAPVLCPSGVCAFGRDVVASDAVLSEDGYPGDFLYRNFYRDAGFDHSSTYMKKFTLEETRLNTGIKYYSNLAGASGTVMYDLAAARLKAAEHAENYIYNRLKQLERLDEHMDRDPIVVCPFDAELFGHYWYEGIFWLEQLIIKMSEYSDSIEFATPSDYLKKYPSNQIATPAFSSWGNNGYSELWLNGSNDWIYRHVHEAIDRMTELAKRYPDEGGLKRKALNQAARELLLAQSSDWPFILSTGSTVPYAESRVKEHIYNFNYIYENLCRNTVNTEWLTKVEKKNNLFPDIDYRVFA